MLLRKVLAWAGAALVVVAVLSLFDVFTVSLDGQPVAWYWLLIAAFVLGAIGQAGDTSVERKVKDSGRYRQEAEMPELTGADFLIGVANQVAESDTPFASQFLMMAQQAVLDEGFLVTQVTAARPLREDEAVAVSIIYTAFQLAMEKGDEEAPMEVLRVGLAMLAKWAEYLAVIEIHPHLSLGGVDLDD